MPMLCNVAIDDFGPHLAMPVIGDLVRICIIAFTLSGGVPSITGLESSVNFDVQRP